LPLLEVREDERGVDDAELLVAKRVALAEKCHVAVAGRPADGPDAVVGACCMCVEAFGHDTGRVLVPADTSTLPLAAQLVELRGIDILDCAKVAERVVERAILPA